MLFARAFTPFLLIFSILFVACVEDKDYGEANNLRPEVNSNANTAVNEKPAEDSTEKLSSMIKIPVEAEETDFRIDDVVKSDQTGDRVPGPKDRVLTVVFRFSDENTAKMVELLKDSKRSFDADVEAEQWFPAELKAKADAEGDQKIKGTAFSAESFAQNPWSGGTVLRIPQTNFFVLRLSTS